MRACYTRASPLLAQQRGATAVRRLHSAAPLSGSSDYVSEQPRPVPREHHFNPLPAPAVVPIPPLPLGRERGAHRRVEPRINPPQGTHTLKLQRDNIRMQFQLEPATRTKVKTEGVNAKIRDYTQAEVFTRAPWPYYREVLLNRPRALHALNPAVILQLQNMIMALEFNKDITAGLLAPVHGGPTLRLQKGAAGSSTQMTYEKSFCAGVDMAALHRIIEEGAAAKQRHAQRAAEFKNDPENAGLDFQPETVADTQDALPGSPLLAKYFRSLYQLSFKMSMVRIPLVTVMDGLTMGAGAGVALQGRYRVATENTRISFPQASLGWFPDAGASYILPRLDGAWGMFLALTGYPVRGFDCVRLGLATHYCESDETHRFGKRIGDSSLNYQFAEDTIEQAFGMFSHSEAVSHFPLPMSQMHRVINNIFGVDTIEQVFLRINSYFEAEQKRGVSESRSNEMVFVEDVLNRLLGASPTSLKCTFKLIKMTQWLPLERCLQLEYRLAQRLLCQLDDPLQSELFRAPNWRVTSFKQIPDSEVDNIFKESWDEDQELVLNYPEKKQPTWYI